MKNKIEVVEKQTVRYANSVLFIFGRNSHKEVTDLTKRGPKLIHDVQSQRRLWYF
jgi:hypothetical protein